MIDKLYQELISTTMEGDVISTRNEVVTRIDTEIVKIKSCPLLSVRRTAWKQALREWEWFMSGSNDTHDLHDSVQHWWKPWASLAGYIQNNYSVQFRCFSGSTVEQGLIHIDQIQHLIDGNIKHPYSRRNVITTWNTAEMAHESTPITNCHGTLIQTFVTGNVLSMTMYQRSADLICGVPHNWIQYWAFLMWLAHRTGKAVGTFKWIGGDIHIYPQHAGIVEKILNVNLNKIDTPQLVYKPTSDNFLADDFTLDRKYVPILTDKAIMVV